MQSRYSRYHASDVDRSWYQSEENYGQSYKNVFYENSRVTINFYVEIVPEETENFVEECVHFAFSFLTETIFSNTNCFSTPF